MSGWWIAGFLALIALPYVYLLFKFAGAGWVAGIRGYLRFATKRKIDG